MNCLNPFGSLSSFIPTFTDGAFSRLAASIRLSIGALTGDNYITAAEAAAVTISGTSRGIADAQAVTIAATDGTNNYAGTATISSDAWTASPVADFTGWDAGTITVTVTLVSDTSVKRISTATLAGYLASIYEGTKDINGAENLASGVGAVRVSSATGSGTVTVYIDGVALSPVFNTATDTTRYWEVAGSEVSWVMSGVTAFSLGQGVTI